MNVTQKQIRAPGCCVLSHNKHLKLKRRESYQQNAELNIKCFYFARAPQQVGQQRLHVVVSGKLLRPGEQLMIVFSLLVY